MFFSGVEDDTGGREKRGVEAGAQRTRMPMGGRFGPAPVSSSTA